MTSLRAATIVTVLPSNHGSTPEADRRSGCARIRPPPQSSGFAVCPRGRRPQPLPVCRLAKYVSSSAVSMPIVAFAKDHHEDPTSNHHVLHELAKVAARAVAQLGRNAHAVARQRSRSRQDPAQARPVREGPGQRRERPVGRDAARASAASQPVARAVNRQVLRATIRALRLRLGIRDFQLWTFLPNVADYVGTLGERVSVYYCVDEWSLFGYLDRDATIAAERELLARVDCVFAVNGALAGREAHLQPRDIRRAPRCRLPDVRRGARWRRHRAGRSRRAAASADSASTARCATGSISISSRASRVRGRAGRFARDRPASSTTSAPCAAYRTFIFSASAVTTSLPGLLQGLRRWPHPVSHRRADDVRQPTEAARVSVGGRAGRIDPVPEVMRYARMCHIAGDPDSFIAAMSNRRSMKAVRQTARAGRAR